jgi:hypothetical protein
VLELQSAIITALGELLEPRQGLICLWAAASGLNGSTKLIPHPTDFDCQVLIHISSSFACPEGLTLSGQEHWFARVVPGSERRSKASPTAPTPDDHSG